MVAVEGGTSLCAVSHAPGLTLRLIEPVSLLVPSGSPVVAAAGVMVGVISMCWRVFAVGVVGFTGAGGGGLFVSAVRHAESGGGCGGSMRPEIAYSLAARGELDRPDAGSRGWR